MTYIVYYQNNKWFHEDSIYPDEGNRQHLEQDNNHNVPVLRDNMSFHPHNNADERDADRKEFSTAVVKLISWSLQPNFSVAFLLFV